MRTFFLYLSLSMFFFSFTYADNVIWSGKVNSNGEASPLVKLVEGKTYQIRVSGTVNLNKWKRQGQALNEDACFDFNDALSPTKNDIFRNTLNISVCEGQ